MGPDERAEGEVRVGGGAKVDMYIQSESMLPLDPLESLDEDYKNAVLHLAWNFDRSSKTRTLLFAWVELLPTEIPPPIDALPGVPQFDGYGPQVRSDKGAGGERSHVAETSEQAGKGEEKKRAIERIVAKRIRRLRRR